MTGVGPRVGVMDGDRLDTGAGVDGEGVTGAAVPGVDVTGADVAEVNVAGAAVAPTGVERSVGPLSLVLFCELIDTGTVITTTIATNDSTQSSVRFLFRSTTMVACG